MSTLKIFKTSLKCTFFSSSLFWLIGNENIGNEFLLLWLISIFILFFISLIMIVTTILPIHEFEKNRLNKNQFVKKYFPYYAIIFFTICFASLVESNFNKFMLTVTITAFFTAMMSWFWLFKTKNY